MITPTNPVQDNQNLQEYEANLNNSTDLDIYNTVTNEFSDALLLCDTLFEQHKSQAVKMMQELEIEYNCSAASEKKTCVVLAVSYIRILELKQMMKESYIFQQELTAAHTCGDANIFYSDLQRHKAYFGCRACNRGKIEVQKYAILSKEMDRATKHYLMAVQTLRMMKQTPIGVKVQVAAITTNNYE